MGGLLARWSGGSARASRGDVRVAACAHACPRPYGRGKTRAPGARAGPGRCGRTPPRGCGPQYVSLGEGRRTPRPSPAVGRPCWRPAGVAREESWARGGSREALRRAGRGRGPTHLFILARSSLMSTHFSLWPMLVNFSSISSKRLSISISRAEFWKGSESPGSWAALSWRLTHLRGGGAGRRFPETRGQGHHPPLASLWAQGETLSPAFLDTRNPTRHARSLVTMP